MPREQTTNYGLWKPEVGVVGTPQWSEDLNDNLDVIDSELKGLQDQVDVLDPDVPADLAARLLRLERLLQGKRALRRMEINTSATIDLNEVGDGILVTATGSGSKVLSIQVATPDEQPDGTADGDYVMQEGQLIVQNFGSGSISFVGLNATISWRDGDGGGIGAQSVPGGLLRFYRYLAFHSSGSSESPPSSRIYMWRVAV